MIAALLYLQFHSTKNRLLMRFKRLKQPKYFVGAIVGGAYFYFYFFRLLLFPTGSRGGASPLASAMSGDPVFQESLRALILFAIVLVAWIIPRQRAALAFTEAEVAFLFPAPMDRRGLVHFKLLRSQLAILCTVLFLTVLSGRYGGGAHWLIHAAGWWVILFTLNLHFIGSSFVLTRLMDRGLATWQRRVAVLALAALAAGLILVWAVREMPELTSASLADFEAIKDYAQRMLVSGPLPYLLYPFRLAVRPYLASDAISFLNVLWPALLLMVAHYFWVIRSDVSFEEASLEASKRLAEKVAAARAGNWRSDSKKLKSKRAPFKLHPGGSPVVALLWKNLISAGSAFTMRLWLLLLLVFGLMSLGLRGLVETSNWITVLGVFAVMVGVWALLFGPQIVRQDLRQDLPHADLLKGFPLRGWQVALGEILAPAVILTGIHWLLLVVILACAEPIAHDKVTTPLLLAAGAAAGVMLPALNLLSLLIPNASVLLFPVWFQAGKEGPAGIEATGQRLIFALGQFLAFIVALIPASAVAGGVFFLMKYFAGTLLAVPVAGLAATLVLALEAGLGVMLLGWLFERFDLSAEQTN